jgi:hypothetical protein
VEGFVFVKLPGLWVRVLLRVLPVICVVFVLCVCGVVGEVSGVWQFL